jgi:hypothetical protein
MDAPSKIFGHMTNFYGFIESGVALLAPWYKLLVMGK